MAKKTWIGGSAAQAQVSTAVVTGYDAATTYTVTVTGEDGSTAAVSVAGTTDAAGTANALRTAWNASINPLVSAMTASGSGADFTLTADTAGVPFYAVASVVGGTGTFGAFSTTTQNRGPSDYNCIANWLEGAIPAAGDDVSLTGSSSILYGLDQDGVEIDSFTAEPGFTGAVGRSGAPLKIDMGDGEPLNWSGTGEAHLHVSSAAVAPRIKRTRSASNGAAGLHLTGTALTTVRIESGVVRLVDATAATVVVGSQATVQIPPGNSITTIHNQGGKDCVVEVAATTINNQAGTLRTEGSGAVGTINVDGGTVVSNSTGTITAANADGGTLDFSQTRAARTCDTLTMRGGSVKYDSTVLTLTNPIVTTAPVEIRAA